jgi:hypothetical protein
VLGSTVAGDEDGREDGQATPFHLLQQGSDTGDRTGSHVNGQVDQFLDHRIVVGFINNRNVGPRVGTGVRDTLRRRRRQEERLLEDGESRRQRSSTATRAAR